MNHLFNNEQKMTEIIFAHRNKAYGAYVIRSSYGETTAKAIGFMLMSITTIMGIAWYLNHNEPPRSEEKNYIPLERDTSIVFVIPHDEEPKLPEPEHSASAASADNERLSTVISDTVEPTESSTVTVENQGQSTGTLSSTSTESTSGGGSSTATGSVIAEVDKSPKMFVDKMPEFKGGIKALMKYLTDHVRYPQEAIELGHEGKYFIRFVVDENGKVSLPEVLNGRYSELNAEALRVVKSIPDFESPGLIDGQPVKTYYQVPINFRLQQ